MRSCVFIFLGMMLTGCSVLEKRGAIKGGDTVIEIHHLAAPGVQVKVQGSNQTATLTAGIEDKDAPTITIAHTEKPVFVISDPNPLLFSYALGEVTSSPTPTAEAADALANALSKVAGTFTPPTTKRDATLLPTCPPFAVQGLEIETFFGNVSTLLAHREQIETTIDRTLLQSAADVSRIKDDVRGWDVLKHDFKTELRRGLKILEEVRTRRLTGEKIEVTVPTEDGACKAQLTHQELVKSPYASLWETFLDLHADSKEILGLLATLEDLQARVAKLGNAQPLNSQIKYSGSLRQVQPIVITPSTTFAAYLSDAAKQAQQRAGTYKVAVEPYERVHLVPSVGVIYSFVKAPKFAAEENDGGQFVITQTSNDYTELGASVAVNLVWDEFFGQPVEPFVQVGVSPDEDNLAFLLGVGVRATDRFTMAAGVAYQRVKELSAGQAVGGIVASPDELKTESEYKSGLYLSLSYKLKE